MNLQQIKNELEKAVKIKYSYIFKNYWYNSVTGGGITDNRGLKHLIDDIIDKVHKETQKETTKELIYNLLTHDYE